MPEAWSVQQVAKQLHCSETHVRRLIFVVHAFPGAYRLGRKLIRIPVTDLDAYQRRARLLVLEARIAHAEEALNSELELTPRESRRRDEDVPLPFERPA